jgi:hypothetical protein
MPLLPPSTNDDYQGSSAAAGFLTFLALVSLVSGLIHTFLPDGGAGVIAGLDLSRNGSTIIGVFAWAGATQLAWGSVLLLGSLRYRPLVPLLLALVLVERSLIALNLWVLKATEAASRPPEAYATLVLLPLVAAALALALRRGKAPRAAAPLER